MNVLVNDAGRALISDFGFCRIIDMHGFTTRNSSQDMMYCPPERGTMYDRETEDSSNATGSQAGDVWSFGMTALRVSSSFLRFLSSSKRVSEQTFT